MAINPQEQEYQDLATAIDKKQKQIEQLGVYAENSPEWQSFAKSIDPSFQLGAPGGMEAGQLNQLKAGLRSKLEGEIEQLTRQQVALAPGIRDFRSQRLLEQENLLRSQMTAQRGEFNTAVDKQLSTLLAEQGFQADEARADTGAAMAGRGLLRSTATSQAIGDVTAQEVQQKSQLRMQAQGQKLQAERQQKAVETGIAQQRRRAEQARTFAELRSAEDAVFNFDMTQLKTDFAKQIQDEELSSQESQFKWGLVGGILGAGAKAFAAGG